MDFKNTESCLGLQQVNLLVAQTRRNIELNKNQRNKIHHQFKEIPCKKEYKTNEYYFFHMIIV
jgi:hypothetical protein